MLITGVRPLGFNASTGPGGLTDIRVGPDGTIAAIGPGLAPDSGEQVIPGEGAFVSPGWCDLHVHAYWKCTNLGVDPASIGPSSGVTVMVDTGSAGFANFEGFRHFIIEPSPFPIIPLLNIGTIGLVYANTVAEHERINFLDAVQTVKCVEKNREWIRGIKVRASRNTTREWADTPVRVAKRVAQDVGLPLMCHVGEIPPTLEEIVPIFEGGDIITHCFHGKPGGILDRHGRLIPVIQAALERGVRLDVGHGSGSFGWSVAEKAVAAGILPHSISSDLHSENIHGPVWDMATTMSKFLHLGLTVEQVIERVTAGALEPLGLSDWVRVAVGSRANLTVFSVADGSFPLRDSYGQTRTGTRAFRPRWAVWGDRAWQADSRNPVIRGEEALPPAPTESGRLPKPAHL